MNEVGCLKGVRFIDDSKATNLAATAAAIEMTGERVRLIAGGQLKEKDLKSIQEILANKTRKVYVIGEASGVLREAWEDAVTCCECDSLENAVAEAWRDAEEGDTVLLSPGCASFDQFSGYAERGDKFVEIVERLKGEE